MNSIKDIVSILEQDDFIPQTLAYSNTCYGRIWVCVYSMTKNEPQVLFRAEKYQHDQFEFAQGSYYETFNQALIAIGVPD
jgi:hypothetical protein